MKRRDFGAALLGAMAGGCARAASEGEASKISTEAPEKIRLVPDDWHISHVGTLADGRLFWIDTQLTSASTQTKDFACTFVFDADGRLNEHTIDLIGVRGEYPNGSVEHTIESHLAALGERDRAPIWVRPFQIESHDAVFGLVPRQLPDGQWRVDFMPGNTLSFYAPWEAGEYDT